jgi:hypothetical protein
MKARNKEEQVQKVFEMLKTLNVLLSYDGNISLNDFLTKQGVSHTYARIMKEKKIIKETKRIGGRANQKTFKWNTIPPNIKMADALADATYNYQRIQNIKNRKAIKAKLSATELREQPQSTPKKQEPKIEMATNKHTKKVSILWGMFKFEKQINK